MIVKFSFVIELEGKDGATWLFGTLFITRLVLADYKDLYMTRMVQPVYKDL